MKSIIPFLFAFILIGVSCSPVKEVTVESKNKKIKEQYYVKRSNTTIKHGSYAYYLNGKKMETGFYVNGVKDSVWSLYNESGKAVTALNYEVGFREGKSTYYWDDGVVRCEGMYKSGKRVGEWVGYHNNGQVSYRGTYNDGDLTGTVKTFREDGSIESEREYEDGELHGVSKTYFKNGKVCSSLEYKEGKPYTLLVLQDKNGRAIDGGTLKEGKGTIVRYLVKSLTDNDTGVTKMSLSTYKNGELHGAYICYGDDGKKVASGQYDLDEISGVWTFWDKEGEHEIKSVSKIRGRLNITQPQVTVPGNKFRWVQSMPSFPGGEAALMRFLSGNVKYPNMAKDAGISGKVFVTFVVESNGQLSGIKIIRGIGGGCDEEVLRIMDLMPKWLPGFQDNIPVRVQFNLPVNFILR